VGIKDVSIALGGRTVLENFDVEIAAGEFVAIVGRSDRFGIGGLAKGFPSTPTVER
jgi:ABC-type nitrate/sulfonate/bicarbonate transport system ATPase subunit